MFNFPKCPKCGNTLPIATGVCATCPISPLPGQEDQSALLAASAEVGQVEGTIPQVYQQYMGDFATLREMLFAGSFKNCREKDALIGGMVGLKFLLQERGFEV